MKVTIYVEGGGDQEPTRTKCRKGFAAFFRKLLPGKAQPKVVPCGGRERAFDDFRTAVAGLGEDEWAILLVDSETPVKPGHSPWQHLGHRVGDRWIRPPGITDAQACLMVQCMESWFIADSENVAKYFDKDFRRDKLPKPDPKTKDVEQIEKKKVAEGLHEATKLTTKGSYHKTKHAFELLELIDPNKVCECSQYATRLRDSLMSHFGI